MAVAPHRQPPPAREAAKRTSLISLFPRGIRRQASAPPWTTGGIPGYAADGGISGEPPVAASAVFGVVVGVRSGTGCTVDAFGGASAAGAWRAGFPGTFGECSHQAVKVVSTAMDGAPRARQDVNGSVSVVDTFRVLVHDHIAASGLSPWSVAHHRWGWSGAPPRHNRISGDACYRATGQSFGAP